MKTLDWFATFTKHYGNTRENGKKLLALGLIVGGIAMIAKCNGKGNNKKDYGKYYIGLNKWQTRNCST